jgi:flagellar hook-length control protein FliK
MLKEQGLKVDTIEVTVGNFEFDRNGQTGDNTQEEQKNGNRRFISDEEISQKDDNDQLAKIFMEGGESTVNYMA